MYVVIFLTVCEPLSCDIWSPVIECHFFWCHFHYESLIDTKIQVYFGSRLPDKIRKLRNSPILLIFARTIHNTWDISKRIVLHRELEQHAEKLGV